MLEVFSLCIVKKPTMSEWASLKMQIQYLQQLVSGIKKIVVLASMAVRVWKEIMKMHAKLNTLPVSVPIIASKTELFFTNNIGNASSPKLIAMRIVIKTPYESRNQQPEALAIIFERQFV